MVKCRADLGNTLAGVYGNNFDVHNTAQKTQSFTLENSDSVFIYIFLFVCLLGLLVRVFLLNYYATGIYLQYRF